MKAMKSSTHEDQEDDRFPFELLSHEIKEMILERVIDETANFDDFKKFWRLRLVNKEFNSILSSNYARRQFYKYPIGLFFRKHNIENYVFMHFVTPDQMRNENRPIQGFYPESTDYRLDSYNVIEWKEVPRYSPGFPFRVSFIDIDEECAVSNDHMILALRELADQASETLDVRLLCSINTHANDCVIYEEKIKLEDFISLCRLPMQLRIRDEHGRFIV